MEKEGSENIHYKYSKEELLTISKLELSLKKPVVLKDECFNDNKRWSPELGFKAMLLESRHSNGNSIRKADIKSDLKIDSNLPPLRPQLGGWGSGCIGMKPAAVTQNNPTPHHEDLSPVRPMKKIIIPPRPQEERMQENPSQPARLGWRSKERVPEFEGERNGRRPPWNEKPSVSGRLDRFERGRYEHRYPNRNGYHREEESSLNDDPWDDPGDTPFDFEPLPGDDRSIDEGGNRDAKELSPKTSPSLERPPSSGNIPRSESPDMETRMMSELLKIFDDSEVTEIPVVTNPGGSRILGLISQQEQPTEAMIRASHAIPNNTGHSYLREEHYPQDQQIFPFQQAQQEGGAVGNDLLQILQKAKINVNSLVTNNHRGVPPLNTMNVPSVKDIEGDMVYRDPRTGRSPPHSEVASENHAFNKLLALMESSKTRTDHNQSQVPQQSHPRPRLPPYEQQVPVSEFRGKSDSVGSMGSPFVPIQVMRRGHFQEQLPRPLVGRTSSIGSNSGYPIQPAANPFGPRMGLSDVEIRHLNQFRPAIGGGPRQNTERNSPVNLLPQSQQHQYMGPQLRGVNYAPTGMVNAGQQHFSPHGGVGLRPSQMPIGVGGPPRGALPGSIHQFQQRPLGQQQSALPPSQSQGPMNLQQLQMLNQHLHSLPPHQLSEMSRGMTNEQLNQMLLRASHQ